MTSLVAKPQEQTTNLAFAEVHLFARLGRSIVFSIMHPRTAFQSVLPGILVVFLFDPPVYAQLPPRLERCLPYPTLAEEIRETKAAEEAEAAPPLKIVIDAIEFEDVTELPGSIRELLLDEIRGHSFEERPGWTDELAEAGLQRVLQDRGYFRADVSAKAEVLSKDAERERVSLSIRVDPGPQYRLGRMQFRSADPDVPLVFPTPELRKLVPMRDGDIFDVSKLRTGFDALKKFYASSGWIDFTPTPNFAIDDAAKQINLTLELDQERQYQVGQIEVWGDNPAAEKILRSELTAGEPFNAFILEKFYSENKSILPLDASPQDDVQVKKDVRTGIVNFRFDFRTCPVVSE